MQYLKIIFREYFFVEPIPIKSVDSDAELLLNLNKSSAHETFVV